MRNPKWHRDEIILALDLYFSSNRGSVDATNPKVVELSKILNALPLFPDRPDVEKFRNPNGVSLKLSNFMAIDPSYKGIGMERGSKLDKEVFNQFFNQRDKLHSIASEIRKITNDSELRQKIYAVEDDDESMKDSVQEGQVLYKLHKVRERDPEIVKTKKAKVLSLYGRLDCEACEFEFEEYYGQIGKGYIECHHRVPLAKIQAISTTSLIDLALVCSNCHRMLHRKIDVISVEDLRTMIRYDRIKKAE